MGLPGGLKRVFYRACPCVTV